MVVQCPNCRARFRVADEKVPERGVKVRCTKCANVFRVTRADGVDASAPRAGNEGFGREGTPAPAAIDPGTPSPPPRSVTGVPPAVSFTYGAASPNQSLDLDLSLGPAPGLRPAPPPHRPSPVPPSPPQPTGSALDAALDAALASGNDPFADLGLPDPPAPSQPPPPRPPAHRRSAPPPSRAMPAPDPFADADFGATEPPPSPAARHAPVPAPGPIDDPFALDEPPPPPRTPRPAAPRPPPEPLDDPFASSATSHDDPFADYDAPAPPSRPAPESSPEPPGLGISGETDNRAGMREFDFSEKSLGTKLDLDYSAVGIEAPHAPVVDLGRIQKPPRAEDAPKGPAASSAARDRVRNELATGLFNALSAVLVGLAAIVAVAALRSPRPLSFSDFGFPVVWMALGFDDGTQRETLAARGLRTGTYPTRAGPDLFYVAGQVENAGRDREALQVAVEIVRSGQILARGESMVGLAAGPEDLFQLDSRKNEDLQRTLAKARAPGRLLAGERAAFVAVFPLTGAEIAGAEIRTTVLEGRPPALRPPPSPAPPPTDAGPQLQLPANDGAPSPSSGDGGTVAGEAPDGGTPVPAPGTP